MLDVILFFKIDPDNDTITLFRVSLYILIKNFIYFLKLNGIDQEKIFQRLYRVPSRDENEFVESSYNSVMFKKIN